MNLCASKQALKLANAKPQPIRRADEGAMLVPGPTSSYH